MNLLRKCHMRERIKERAWFYFWKLHLLSIKYRSYIKKVESSYALRMQGSATRYNNLKIIHFSVIICIVKCICITEVDNLAKLTLCVASRGLAKSLWKNNNCFSMRSQVSFPRRPNIPNIGATGVILGCYL